MGPAIWSGPLAPHRWPRSGEEFSHFFRKCGTRAPTAPRLKRFRLRNRRCAPFAQAVSVLSALQLGPATPSRPLPAARRLRSGTCRDCQSLLLWAFSASGEFGKRRDYHSLPLWGLFARRSKVGQVSVNFASVGWLSFIDWDLWDVLSRIRYVRFARIGVTTGAWSARKASASAGSL